VVVGADGRPYVDQPNSQDQRLKCADGYTPLQVGVGSHTEGTTSYVVEAITKGKGDDRVQTDVKVWAQPPAGVSVPAAIVHTTGSSDRELDLNIGKGGSVSFTLHTAAYSHINDYPEYYPVASITFCTTRR